MKAPIYAVASWQSLTLCPPTNVSSSGQEGYEHVHHTLWLHDLVQNVCGADELEQSLACGCHKDWDEGREHIVCKILRGEHPAETVPTTSDVIA